MKYIFKLLTLIVVVVVFILLFLGTRVLILKSSKKEPGSIHRTNIVLDNIEFKKTSEIVVIPKNDQVTIKTSDNSFWDSIVSEKTSENWRGVFIKNRAITLSSFSMAQYPVTQELFTKIMGFNPSYFKKENLNIKYSYTCIDENPDLRPADTLSWFDAIVFCNKLTISTMKISDCVYYADSRCTIVYTLNDAQKRVNPFFYTQKKGYRLPTEAEWEFAARGGDTDSSNWYFAFSGTQADSNQVVYDTKKYSFIDSNLEDYGWYRGNSNGVTHEVGKKRPNALGLYDMSGGVWEWLYDWYDNTIYPEKIKNPYGAQNGTDRVLRGGSWFEDAYGCCVTRRFHNAHPYIPHFYFGFRYCRSL